MNNWNTRSKMVVAVRAKDVAVPTFEQAVKAIAIDEGMDIEGITRYDDDTWIYSTGGLDTHTIDVLMSCLDDHMNNTPGEELADIEGNLWGGCISTLHSQEGKECYGQAEDCISVNVGTFTYHGPDCDIDCYYVSE